MHDAHPPLGAVREAVARALAEDLTPIGDLSAALVPPDRVATARFVPRAPGVLAGGCAPTRRSARSTPALAIEWAADDGDRGGARGRPSPRSPGLLAPILTAERTALNFLGHLSGVATLTARFVDAVAAAGGSLRVWDTRKTTPGLRAMEKAAVRAGGGCQPPGQPVRLGDAQGQPPGRARHRRGGRPRPAAVAGAHDPRRVRRRRPDGPRGGRRPGPTPCCSTTCRPTRWRPSWPRCGPSIPTGRCIEVSGGIDLATIAGLRHHGGRHGVDRRADPLGPGPRHRARRRRGLS